jgi:hypothetical protein
MGQATLKATPADTRNCAIETIFPKPRNHPETDGSYQGGVTSAGTELDGRGEERL